jgi:hypothetical protein
MTKLKSIGFGVLAVTGVLVVASIAMAQTATTPLSVSCSGTVTGNVVTWAAVANGGNAPYTFTWGGNSQIVGDPGSNVSATYLANGTYIGLVAAVDASSTSASSSCQAVVTYNVATPPSTTAPTSTLNVSVSVNNNAGGTAAASNFGVKVNGANASPSSFVGTSGATAVALTGGASYSVASTYLPGYTASMSGNCSGPIATGGTDSCTVTETYAPSATNPSTPRVNPPTLSVDAHGNFLSRGMTVTSVGTNSFTATVWGITYTVNWSGNLENFEFLLRSGNTSAGATPSTQLNVGDEVGVSGVVTSGSPLVVTANVVRDYSITQLRPTPASVGGGNGNGNGNAGNNNSANQSRLQQLLQQLQQLQLQFNNTHSGGNQ